MTASMLDEVQVPKSPKFYVCPCCIFSFNELPKFIEHCESIKRLIDTAIVKAQKGQP